MYFRKGHLRCRYDKLPDGVHPIPKVNTTWTQTLKTVITRNRASLDKIAPSPQLHPPPAPPPLPQHQQPDSDSESNNDPPSPPQYLDSDSDSDEELAILDWKNDEIEWMGLGPGPPGSAS